MTPSTVCDLFLAIFSTDEVERIARETKAFDRLRAISPLPFVLALLNACCGGDKRTIASAHLAFEHLTGVDVARSSFDEKIASPHTVALLWRLFAQILLHGNRVERRSWPPALQQFYDVMIDDGTTIYTRKSLADRLRSTTPGQAALKLLAHFSLQQGCLEDVRFAAAVHHDHKLLRAKIVVGTLILRDLGFYEHAEFARIDDAGAFFVSLLKDGVRPIIERVVEGVLAPENPLGMVFHKNRLLTDRVVDLDARFRVAGHPSRTFRVVGLWVPCTRRHDKPTGAYRLLWWVTNLSREQASAEAIGALYRLGYAVIERLFRRVKSLAKLKHLDSERMPIVMGFVLASLLVETLAAKLAKQLEDRWGLGEVSVDRMLKVLVRGFWDLCRCLCGADPKQNPFWREWLPKLLKWGAHPNPSQPSRVAHVLDVVA